MTRINLNLNVLIRKHSIQLLFKLKKYYILSFILICNLVFSQKNNFSVTGIVLDTFGILPGVTIGIDSIKAYTFTNPNGKFILFDIPKGHYNLKISALGYKNLQLPIVVDSVSNSNLSILLQFDNTLNEIEVVTRQRSNQVRSINKTKNSLKIVTIKSVEEINKLPAKNAADIAARLPSIVAQRNQGENNIISLRGTPSDWSAVLINGDRLPVACEDNTTRSFEFEAFPSDFVDEVVEARTITPDMESDNIGGSINFYTRPAPFEKIIETSIAGGYNFLSKKPTGNFKIMYGDVSKNKKWSFITNASYYARNYATDAIKVIYGTNLNHGVNALELRRYDGLRITKGANLCIEYKPSLKFKIATHAFFGKMTDDKYMKKESFNWIDDSGRRIRLQNAYGLSDRQIFGGDVFAEINPYKRLKITTKIAMYDNEFKYGPSAIISNNDPRNGFLVNEFMTPLQVNFTDFSIVDKFGKPIDVNSPDAIYIKLIGADEPYGKGDNPNNILPHYTNVITASEMHYNQSYTETNNTKERDALVAQIDVEYQLGNKLKLQSGGKYRNKVGYRHISKHDWFQDYSKPGNNYALTLADFELVDFTNNSTNFLNGQGASYQNHYFPFLSNQASANFISNNQGKLREVYMDKYNFEYYKWVGSSYDYTENQTSGYVMLTYVFKKIAVLGGIRVENTILKESSDTLTNEVAFDPITNNPYYLPKTRYVNNNYTGILPSLNSAYTINPNSIIRLSSSRTMHRPNFEQTKPGSPVLRYNELKNTAGNPNLKPVFSFNFDLNFDYYWGSRGMFSLGAYYKKIKNHIFTISTSQTDAVTGITLKTFDNSSNAWVAGLEALLNRKFNFLKGAWSGLGINTNITYSFSRMKVQGRPSSQQMTDQTPLLFGITLYYEYKKIETRMALLYNGTYLAELNLASLGGEDLLHKDSDYDIFMSEYYSLDYSFSYKITKRINAILELSNLLNAPEKKYVGKTWRLASAEFYRLRGEIGIHFQL
ncbi:MAG: TonB-dependent receptor [Bacteroidota bacterium]|nr:TonB-dependent receptor [Bacteroidota bacterium]